MSPSSSTWLAAVKLALATLILCIPFPACADGIPRPVDLGPLCHELLQEHPALTGYDTLFTDTFKSKVSLADLTSVFAEVYKETGSCLSYNREALGNSAAAKVTLRTASGLDVALRLVMDPDSGRLGALLIEGIEDPKVVITGWSDVAAALRYLDPTGTQSAALVSSDRGVLLATKGSQPLAIGSTFKLYVLGALSEAIAQGRFAWDTELAIRDAWKSLPSGIMHTWPEGQRATLLTYAQNMIGISDNTATDHLLFTLGRDQVEDMLAPMGNRSQVSHLPFLSTLEAFKIKWALTPDSAHAYVSARPAGRRVLLDEIADVPRSAIGTNGLPMNEPTLIDSVEWFATTTENCAAMLWLAARADAEVRSILAQNVPLLTGVGTPASHWSYAGYKGGSEPGVLNLTFLLESRNGQRGCLAVTANNTRKNLNESRFFDIVKKTLRFAESQLP